MGSTFTEFQFWQGYKNMVEESVGKRISWFFRIYTCGKVNISVKSKERYFRIRKQFVSRQLPTYVVSYDATVSFITTLFLCGHDAAIMLNSR